MASDGRKFGLAAPGTPAGPKRTIARPPPPTNPEKLPEPLLATLLRMFVYTITAAVFAWPLTV